VPLLFSEKNYDKRLLLPCQNKATKSEETRFLSDCLTYLVRKKVEQEQTGVENAFTRLFDKHLLDDLDPHTRATGFKAIYAFSKKFNFFESTA